MWHCLSIEPNRSEASRKGGDPFVAIGLYPFRIKCQLQTKNLF
jgi:hypothetical protein